MDPAAHNAPLLLTAVLCAAAAVLSMGSLWRLRAQRAALQRALARASIDLAHANEARRQTDLRLQDALLEAQAANRAKTRYLVTVSHELRTPLNSLLGYAHLLGDDPGIPPNRRRAVEVIREAGDHLLGVIDHTLDIARIEAGRLNLDLQPVPFPELIEGLVHLFEMQAIDKGLDFDYRCEGRLPPVVRADGRRLRQVLINILGNAIKFTQQGRVSLHLRYARQMAYFEIRDTGPGIPEADQARIFEAFEQGGAGHKPPISGSGVGLTIARMLTDLMGGKLQLQSMPGAGCCFRLKLFLPEQVGLTPPEVVLPRKVLGYRGRRRRLLVIDDEPHDREFLLALLRPLGFLLTTAPSAETGMALLNSFQPDLVLMDIDLPGMNGWEAIRTLREAGHQDVQVAVLTAHGPENPGQRPRRFRSLLAAAEGTAEWSETDAAESEAAALLARGDYLQKPLRVEPFLAWLGRRLDLDWAYALPEVTETAVRVPESAVAALRALVQEGYLRGIQRELEILAGLYPASAPWLQELGVLAERFQFERLLHQLDQQATP